MSRFTNPLDHVKVAAPCPADWEKMGGDDRVRFCSQCNLNVYNLSGMTKAAAETLLANAEGRVCVRYYRRADGSILTADCPVGVRALGRRVARAAGAALSAAIGFGAGLGLYSVASNDKAGPVGPGAVMGAVAISETHKSSVMTRPADVREEPPAVLGRLVVPVERIQTARSK